MKLNSNIASVLLGLMILSTAAPALAQPSLDGGAGFRFEGRISQAPGHDKVITFYTCDIDNNCTQYGQPRDLSQWEKMGRRQNREHYELYGAAALAVVGLGAGGGVLGFLGLGAGGPGLVIGGGAGAALGGGLGALGDQLSSYANSMNPSYHLRRAEIVTDLVKHKELIPVNSQNQEALDADLAGTPARAAQ